MPAGQRSRPSRAAGDDALAPVREVRLSDGSAATVRLRMIDPHGDRATVVADDAAGRIAGRAGYRRVYGARAELTLALGDDVWSSGLSEVLVATLGQAAAQQGISRFLVRLPVDDERVRTLLVGRFGAREVRSADSADLELPTAVEPA